MTTWTEFYNEIRDPSWPECAQESNFAALPAHIQSECQTTFGYIPGQFAKQSKLPHRVFPIKTETACQLKWNWSTLYLTTEETASCHRANHHKFDTEQFDFHNTPSKLDDRMAMLQGQWPKKGCKYCRNIESAGGQSDRITNLDLVGMHAPVELDDAPGAVLVTPRILEVYFDNTCNLKCVYCGPHFSSLWDAENIRAGLPAFNKSKNIEQNKSKLFEWLKQNRQHLTVFNILGGEPLYQQEFGHCLDLFEQYPAPELKLQIFSNLNTKLPHLQQIVERVKKLIDRGCLREFEITASLDCWGKPQEYVRYPLDLIVWQKNFEYLLGQNWINLIVSSTVTPLTIKTLPDLLTKIAVWNQTRPVYHYQNSVDSPDYLCIDIFGKIFQQDFAAALALKLSGTPEQRASRNYLQGIAIQSASSEPDIKKIVKLFNFLNNNDAKRNLHWSKVFPWLVDEFAKYNLKL